MYTVVIKLFGIWLLWQCRTCNANLSFLKVKPTNIATVDNFLEIRGLVDICWRKWNVHPENAIFVLYNTYRPRIYIFFYTIELSFPLSNSFFRLSIETNKMNMKK